MRALWQALFSISLCAKMPFFTGFPQRTVAAAPQLSARRRPRRRAPRRQCCDSRCEVGAKHVFRQRRARAPRAAPQLRRAARMRRSSGHQDQQGLDQDDGPQRRQVESRDRRDDPADRPQHRLTQRGEQRLQRGVAAGGDEATAARTGKSRTGRCAAACARSRAAPGASTAPAAAGRTPCSAKMQPTSTVATSSTATTEAVSTLPIGGSTRRSGRISGLVSCTTAWHSGLRKSARVHCSNSRASTTNSASDSSVSMMKMMALMRAAVRVCRLTVEPPARGCAALRQRARCGRCRAGPRARMTRAPPGWCRPRK